MHQFPPHFCHIEIDSRTLEHLTGISLYSGRCDEEENGRRTRSNGRYGVQSSHSAPKSPASPHPLISIYLSKFLHCYDKCVCIMKVGVKWPHSDPCVAFVSCLFEFRLFLSSLSPYRARRRVPQRLCVWWMKLGHFFLALLSLSVRGSIQRYTKWWLETHGFIASLNTFPFDQGLGLVLIDVFIIYCPHDVLCCTARHESGCIWSKED